MKNNKKSFHFNYEDLNPAERAMEKFGQPEWKIMRAFYENDLILIPNKKTAFLVKKNKNVFENKL